MRNYCRNSLSNCPIDPSSSGYDGCVMLLLQGLVTTTTPLQGVTMSKWRRLTTVYQGLSIRFRRALTLLRGNDRVTAKSWSTRRGAIGEGKFLLSNMALSTLLATTICLSTASTVLLAFWYCSCSLKVFTLENASQNFKNYFYHATF